MLFSFKFIESVKSKLGLIIPDGCHREFRAFAIEKYSYFMRLSGDDQIHDMCECGSIGSSHLHNSKENIDSINIEEETRNLLNTLKDKNNCRNCNLGAWLRKNKNLIDYSNGNQRLVFRAFMTLGDNDWFFEGAANNKDILSTHLKYLITDFTNNQLEPLWKDAWMLMEECRSSSLDEWDESNLILYDSDRDDESETVHTAPLPVVWPYGFIANLIVYINFEMRYRQFIGGLAKKDMRIIMEWLSKSLASIKNI